MAMKKNRKVNGDKFDVLKLLSTIGVVGVFIIAISSLVISNDALNEVNRMDKESTDIQKELYRIENETYKAIEPFQKPIISPNAVDLKANITQYLNAIKIKFDIVFYFKNVGKGIAQDTKIIIYMANLDHPELLREVSNETTVNDIYPDSGDIRMAISFEYTDNTLVLKKSELAFILRTEYTDKVSGENQNQTFWYRYPIGSNAFNSLNLQEKTKLMPYYEDLILF